MASSPSQPDHRTSDEEEEENSPVEQVAITVSTRDDPTLPSVTIRTWVLGVVSCVILSFLNQFFGFRRNPLSITAVSAQIAVVPLGHLMARALPNKVIFPGSRLAFSLNPGPFNVKEHVLITIFANSGAGGIYAIHIITSLKIFYRQHVTFLMSFILVLTTQVLGFGWAGIFRRYLVEPAAMWWPGNLVQVTLFRALHEKEVRAKGGINRNQFFLAALMCSFAYYIFPGYLFSMLSSISWVCWIFPHSVTAQQVGSGLYGLGLGAFALDWSAIASYLGSPLASPWFATANIGVGYVIIMYILVPMSYWLNVYKAKTFPIFSSHFFDGAGQQYETSSIINSNFQFDVDAYETKGPLYLSTFFAMTYGVGFAALTATLSHVAIFNGKEIIKMTKSALNKEMDIHTRLMRKYKQVPEWWFQIILVANIGLTVFVCEYYNHVLQLPWWGVLMACALSIFFTLPVGVIAATTNQAPGLNIITEYIMGVILPGQPAANVCFKTYGYISTLQALTFLADFKLGHYMKIPPRSMFMAQVVGTVIAAFVYLSTAWWLLEGIPNICNVNLLPADSPWTCPIDRVFYDASVIWGLISPRRIFGDLGTYAAINWFFLAGAVGPAIVWIVSKIFPTQKWIRLINMPVLIGATGMLPPASSVNFNSWLVMGFISGFVVYRYKRDWWSKYNYVLSAALDAGLAFMGVLLYFTLQANNISLTWWGTNPDGCPLAECPTEKGIRVNDICPVYS